MRQFIIAALAAILAACGQQKGFADEGEERVAVSPEGTYPSEYLIVVHDRKRGVTCYVLSAGTGLFCIPDSQLPQVAP